MPETRQSSIQCTEQVNFIKLIASVFRDSREILLIDYVLGNGSKGYCSVLCRPFNRMKISKRIGINCWSTRQIHLWQCLTSTFLQVNWNILAGKNFRTQVELKAAENIHFEDTWKDYYEYTHSSFFNNFHNNFVCLHKSYWANLFHDCFKVHIEN